MANIPPPGGASSSSAPAQTPSANSSTSSTGALGTGTSWHMVILWFLGAIALIALADPAPGIATALVLLIILGTLLNNWATYKSYIGLK